MSAWGGPAQCATTALDPYSTNSAASLPLIEAAHNVPTKQARVLRALLARPATSFELERAPVFDHCANSTVAELRRQGFGIQTEMVTVPGYGGRSARIARYHLHLESRAAAQLLAFPAAGAVR